MFHSMRRLHIFRNHIVASSYCNLRSSRCLIVFDQPFRRLVVFDQPFRRLVVFKQPFRRLVVVFFSSSSRRLVGLLIRLSKPGSSPIFEEKWRPRRGEWFGRSAFRRSGRAWLYSCTNRQDIEHTSKSIDIVQRGKLNNTGIIIGSRAFITLTPTPTPLE